MIKLTIAALLLGQVPTYWYGVDASGVVQGWKTGSQPAIAEFPSCTAVYQGSSASALTVSLGEERTGVPERVPRWRWDSPTQTVTARSQTDIDADKAEILAPKVIEAYKNWKAAQDLQAAEPALIDSQDVTNRYDAYQTLKTQLEALQ